MASQASLPPLFVEAGDTAGSGARRRDGLPAAAAVSSLWRFGFAAGCAAGCAAGFAAGFAAGCAAGFAAGFAAGLTVGVAVGLAIGLAVGDGDATTGPRSACLASEASAAALLASRSVAALLCS